MNAFLTLLEQRLWNIWTLGVVQYTDISVYHSTQMSRYIMWDKKCIEIHIVFIYYTVFFTIITKLSTTYKIIPLNSRYHIYLMISMPHGYVALMMCIMSWPLCHDMYLYHPYCYIHHSSHFNTLDVKMCSMVFIKYCLKCVKRMCSFNVFSECILAEMSSSVPWEDKPKYNKQSNKLQTSGPLAGAKPLSESMLEIVNWTLGNKFQWNLNQNLFIFIQESAFENVIWKMAAI